MAYTPQVFPHENNPITFGRSLSPGQLEGLLHQLRIDQKCAISIKEKTTGLGELTLNGSQPLYCIITNRWIGFAYTENHLSADARAVIQKGVESYLKKID